MELFFNMFIISPLALEVSLTVFYSIFYIAFFLLLLLSALYVAISIKTGDRQFTFVSGITFFIYSANLFNSVLLIPLLHLVSSIFNCSQSLKPRFADVGCFEGSHMAAFIMAVFSTIIILYFSFIFAFFLFEVSVERNSICSKIHNLYDKLLVALKISQVFAFEVLSSHLDEQNFLLSLLILCLGLALYAVAKCYNPYQDSKVRRASQISASVNLYACGLLFVQKVFYYFEIEDFQMYTEIFLIGAVFICLYVLFYKSEKSEKLIINIRSMTSPFEVLRNICFYLALFSKHLDRRKYSILLKGYIVQHEEYCTYKECYLTNYKEKFLFKGNRNQQEELRLLAFHCDHLFEEAVTKFPEDIALRCFYCNFLLEVMKNEAKAKIHLTRLSKSCDSLSYEFVFYRIERHINENKYMYAAQAGADMTSTILFQQYSKKFKETLELVGSSYMEFWNMLSQDDISN